MNHSNPIDFRFPIRFLFFLISILLSGLNATFSQCTLNVQDVNYCNTNSAVLGIGMQLTLGPIPITSSITSYSSIALLLIIMLEFMIAGGILYLNPEIMKRHGMELI